MPARSERISHALRLVVAVMLATLAGAAFCAQARAASTIFQTPCVPGQAEPMCFGEQGKVVAVDDGDTIDVRIPGAGTHRVRFTGINAAEQTVYTSNPARERGECHSLDATFLVTNLINRSHGQVRLVYQNRLTRAGVRLVRDVQVFIRGTWHDVDNLLVARGLALFMPNGLEYAWNRQYNILAQRAAARGIGMFDTTFCGFGPDQDLPIHLVVKADAPGNDNINVNGEWVRIYNQGVRPLPLGGWWLRAAGVKRYHFPDGVAVPPGDHITVHVGRGTDTIDTLYWGLHYPIFTNPTKDPKWMGNGAYLFDPDGDLRAWDMYPCLISPCPNT